MSAHSSSSFAAGYATLYRLLALIAPVSNRLMRWLRYDTEGQGNLSIDTVIASNIPRTRTRL